MTTTKLLKRIFLFSLGYFACRELLIDFGFCFDKPKEVIKEENTNEEGAS